MYDTMISRFGLIDEESDVKIEDETERHRVWDVY